LRRELVNNITDWIHGEPDFTYRTVYYAFLDLLGYRGLMKEKASEAPKWLYAAISDALREAEGLYPEVAVRLLSDSIHIHSPANCLRNFFDLVNVVQLVCKSFMSKGVLVRGGIAEGKHFTSNEVIVSEALVDAYTLECEHAVYPRILIENGLFDRVLLDEKVKTENSGKRVLQENGVNRFFIAEAFMRDHDGFAVLNPVWYDQDIYVLLTGRSSSFIDGDKIPTAEEVRELCKLPLAYLKNLKEVIRAGITAHRPNLRITAKYRYLFKRYEAFILASRLTEDQKAELLVDLRSIARC
jgi:hypothetical protein